MNVIVALLHRAQYSGVAALALARGQSFGDKLLMLSAISVDPGAVEAINSAGRNFESGNLLNSKSEESKLGKHSEGIEEDLEKVLKQM